MEVAYDWRIHIFMYICFLRIQFRITNNCGFFTLLDVHVDWN